MSESNNNPYDALRITCADSKRTKIALEQYHDALRRLDLGTFPVKEGSVVFRVINGLRVGRSSAGLKIGDQVTSRYATPHPDAVRAIIAANDGDQTILDGSPFDPYQRIAVISVDSFEIPWPDVTHGVFGDRDQVIVTGTVKEILTPNEFFEKCDQDDSDCP